MISDKYPLHEEGTSSSFAYIDKFKQKNLKFMPCNFLKRNDFHRIRGKIAFSLVALLLAVLSINTACAALSATTLNPIEGRRPELSAALVADINAGNDFELLGLDVGGNQYFTASDIAAKFPSGIGVYTPASALAQLGSGTPAVIYKTPLENQANDQDGDAFTTGALSGSAAVVGWFYINNSGVETALTDTEMRTTFCKLIMYNKRPYLKLQGPVTLQTEYGEPNKEVYDITVMDSPIYSTSNNPVRKFHFNGAPSVCLVRPNLNFGDNDDFVDSSYTDWRPVEGFLGEPTMSGGKTFPTTGFYGAKFDLILVGTTAKDIVNFMTSSTYEPFTPTQNGVRLKLERGQQEEFLTVTLYGPVDGSSGTAPFGGAPTSAFSPTKFTIQDATTSNIYTFTLEKWFIAGSRSMPYSSGGSNQWAESYPYGFNGNLETPNYCKDLGGKGSNYYRVPTRSELTNSEEIKGIAFNGIAGTGWSDINGTGYSDRQPNFYRRVIGAGMTAEWGNIEDFYSESLFDVRLYWTSEAAKKNSQYTVFISLGAVDFKAPQTQQYPVCVSK